jgi:hypothetical protein
MEVDWTIFVAVYQKFSGLHSIFIKRLTYETARDIHWRQR